MPSSKTLLMKVKSRLSLLCLFTEFQDHNNLQVNRFRDKLTILPVPFR